MGNNTGDVPYSIPRHIYFVDSSNDAEKYDGFKLFVSWALIIKDRQHDNAVNNNLFMFVVINVYVNFNAKIYFCVFLFLQFSLSEILFLSNNNIKMLCT